jgi:prepilin-type N-terminal cleavage/methylation domain-containing protein
MKRTLHKSSSLKRQTNAGFTMLEVMVTLGVIGIMIVFSLDIIDLKTKNTRVSQLLMVRNSVTAQLLETIKNPKAIFQTASTAMNDPAGNKNRPDAEIANRLFGCIIGSAAQCTEELAAGISTIVPAGNPLGTPLPFFLYDGQGSNATLGNLIAGVPGDPVYYGADGRVCTTLGPTCLFQAISTFLPDCRGAKPCNQARRVRIQVTVSEVPGVRTMASDGFFTKPTNVVYDISLPMDLAPVTGTTGTIPMLMATGIYGPSPLRQDANRNIEIGSGIATNLWEVVHRGTLYIIGNVPTPPPSPSVLGIYVENGLRIAGTISTPSLWIGDPDASPQVYGNLSSGQIYSYSTITVSGTARAPGFLVYSDESLKERVTPISKKDYEKVDLLEAVRFQWRANNEEEFGFIAQDVKKIFPELVTTDKQGKMFVAYQKIVPLLLENYKEDRKSFDLEYSAQQKRINKLKEILCQQLQQEEP